ncbi:MAG: MBL fold metallo-hydrolase [Alphaproteobacteria bacterium]
MASLDQRLPVNVAGDFFVDATCIDCGTCRWVAPESFDAVGEKSRVYRQPANDPAARLRAEMALIACPVAAIGTESKHDLAPARGAFPEPLAEEVYYCGYHAEASYGAAAYLIRRPGGNILVDSPRFAGPLVSKLEALGGVRYMFLTHQDDVADHERFHAHFGCERILHADDVTAGTRKIEIKLDGSEPIRFADDVTFLPVPGHTRGSVCLLYRDIFVFSGDHVAWSEDLGHIYAFRDACWYNWRALVRSMERLAEYDFEWILPGHGRRCRFPAAQMRAEMRRGLEWMRRQ